MRYADLLIAVAALGSSAEALSYQFPTPENPRARASLERTQMDTAKLNALLSFAKPVPKAWPCEPPLAYLYQPANIVAALPEDQLPAEIKTLLDDGKRATRRSFRAQGMDPAGAPVFSYTNIELIPVTAQCVDGQLDGAVEYFVSYESKMETSGEQFSTLTNRVEKNRTVMNDAVQMLVSRTFKAGKPESGHGTRSVRRGSMVNRSYFENPLIQKSVDESLTKTGVLNRPTNTGTVVFDDPASMVTFSLMEAPEVSAGVFGTNTTWSTKLSTSVILIGEKAQETYMYSEGQPLSIMRKNKETSTTESVSYVDNFVKKMGKKLSDMPGMENFREVALGGRDMLEVRMCMIDYKPVKMDPCPVE